MRQGFPGGTLRARADGDVVPGLTVGTATTLSETGGTTLVVVAALVGTAVGVHLALSTTAPDEGVALVTGKTGADRSLTTRVVMSGGALCVLSAWVRHAKVG
jgi:hypothetical protein